MRIGYYWWRLAATALLGLASMSQASETAEAGNLVYTSGSQGSALHLGTRLDINVQGLQAQVRVAQRFQNTSSEWVNAAYVYPLAEDSAVSGLKMLVGERVIVGEIKEKAEARKTFEAAKASGKKATLVEQQRPNLFRQEVANIAPGEIIEVHLGYSQQVIYDAGEFRLRLPTTLTPRYIPGVSRAELLGSASVHTGASGWSLPTDQVEDAHLITPAQYHNTPGRLLNPMSLNLALNAGMPLAKVNSATHKLAIDKPAGAAQGVRSIQFAAGEVSMDRDIELSWLPEPQAAPVAAQFVSQWQGERYAQLMLMPPRELAEHQVLPRELILIVDTSGSMAGNSIEQARTSSLLALNQLTERDRFNVIFFSSSTHTVFEQAVAATPANLASARQSIERMRADGGTEMHSALSRAFDHDSSGEHLQQIVFVTDGSVGNESALLTLIHRRLGDARLFTVAIGSAPNRFFMRRAAEFGRGSFTEIATADQVQERMAGLLSKLQKPVVANVQIDWPQPVEAFPRTVPDLYWGEPILVTAKLPPWPSRSDARVVITGESAGKPWQRELVLSAGEAPLADVGVPVLAQRFGREKIAFLEDEAYRAGNSEQARDTVLPVALQYQLMSRFTSLVAVDKTPSRPAQVTAKDGAIANAMPAGSGMQAVGYPQTANGLLWHLLMGALALVGLLVLNSRGVVYVRT